LPKAAINRGKASVQYFPPILSNVVKVYNPNDLNSNLFHVVSR